MKKYLLATVLLAVIFTIPRIFATYEWRETKISRVLSSNVFVTLDDKKWRIIGVLPNDEFSSNKREACHAKGNSREISELLLDNKIFSATDEKVKDALHLKIGKEYVTEIILRKGWAKMNDDEVSSYFSARFKRAQELAQKEKLGLWGPCLDDLNWQKIRGNFGERMRKLKRENPQFLGSVAVGEVVEVLSGNEFRLKNGPIVRLADVEIPRENNSASRCFQKNSRNYLENLILGKKVRLEKPVNSREIMDYKLVRVVYLEEGNRLKKLPHPPEYSELGEGANLNFRHHLAGGKNKNFRHRLAGHSGISVNEKMIRDGFGKFAGFSKPHPNPLLEGEGVLKELQKEVYANPRGAWAICAREILNTSVENPAKNSEIREIDENCPIKGNISGTKANPIKTYHTVLSGWYDRVQPEQCFQTEEEANLAGFRKVK